MKVCIAHYLYNVYSSLPCNVLLNFWEFMAQGQSKLVQEKQINVIRFRTGALFFTGSWDNNKLMFNKLV